MFRGLVAKEKLERFRQRFDDVSPPSRMSCPTGCSSYVFVCVCVQICSGKVERDLMLQVVRDVALRKEQVCTPDKVTKLQNYENDEVLFEYVNFDAMILRVTSSFVWRNLTCGLHCRYPQLPEILHVVKAIVGVNVMSVHTSMHACSGDM